MISAASDNVIAGNIIGTDVSGMIDLGNGSAGIRISGVGSNNNTIGGVAAGEGNVIAFNDNDGLQLQNGSGTGNSMLGNSIYGNSQLGIDLHFTGGDNNDPGDADTGANNRQNFPVITTAETNGVNAVTIAGTIDTNGLNQDYRLEFFASSVADPSGRGEAERFLGFVDVTTDGSGDASFNTVISAVVAGGEFITATATVNNAGDYGDTSEFSLNAAATLVGTLIVDTTSDVSDGDTSSVASLLGNRGGDGRISLREAIEAANATAGLDTIEFEIADPLVGGVHTINVGAGGLDMITDAIIIDATTESDFAGSPIIVLNGASSGSVNGLSLLGSASDGSTIRGLIINQFRHGISINDSDNNVIAANWIGLDQTGTSDQGNTGFGIRIFNASGNTIGGASAADRNLISGNDLSGISIESTASTGNVVQGNYIGTDATGTTAIGNSHDGVRISGGANANTIGGDRAAGEANVISGNLNDGVELNDLGTDNNLIHGNYIGTDFSGVADLGNGRHGVVLYNGVQHTQVGGTGIGEGNIISGNASYGIVIDGNFAADTHSNVIAGNTIGLNLLQDAAIDNGSGGVHLFFAGNNTIGGTTPAAGNTISGNLGDGIRIEANSTGVSVLGNYIGTNGAGTSAIGNAGNGIEVFTSGNVIGSAGAGNVISGNTGNGVALSSIAAASNSVQGNFIGTNMAGTAAVANLQNGIRISGADNTIGGTGAGEGNLISGNGNNGIYVLASSASGNQILGNLIGTDGSGNAALGNTWNGVSIASLASDNDIGDGSAAGRNIISGNQHGVTISGAFTSDNRVRGNYIGTDITGTLDLGNTWQGINAGGDNTIIGGIAQGNVISGNDSRGIYVNSGSGLVIQGNYIGTNAAGSAAIANSEDGINIVVSGVQIGGATAGQGNVISGNAWSGISLTNSGASGNTVSGNIIGLDATGTTIIGNGQQGVYIAFGANNNTIGGTIAASRNIISGNTNGVYINGTGSDSNTISGNYIGTDITGTLDRGNTASGIYVNGGALNVIDNNVVSGNDAYGIYVSGAAASGTTISGNLIGLNAAGTASLLNADDAIHLNAAAATQIGGNTAADRNVINAAFGEYGVYTFNTTDTTIEGNFIGTDSLGTTALSGGSFALNISDSADTTIGGTASAEANVIAAYAVTGINISGAGSSGTSVAGNYIGTDVGGTIDLTSGLYGIALQLGVTGVTIGGTAAGAGNTIAFNGTNGIRLMSTAGSGNAIRQNLIYSNGGIGIDLNGDGTTANDLGDGDSGANNLINTAVIYDVDISGANVTITGEAVSGSTVEFFLVSGDGDTHGEASGFIGSGVVAGATPGVNDPSAMQFSFVFAVGSLVDTDAVTATVTDASNNTSEFAANVDVENAPSNITPNSFAVDEWTNTSSGYSVGTLTSTDSDVGDTFTYTITGGADQTKFSIGGGNLDELILTDGTLDFETQSSYDVTVRTTDSTGRWYEETLVVNINDRNDAPTIATNTGVTVLEGSAGTQITSAMLNEGDVDDNGTGLIYTITDVADNGMMYLAGYGELGLNDTFTQADIDSGNVTYDHDDSETTGDSFSFSLADGGEDGAATVTGTFNITVTPVNDNSITTISDADVGVDFALENTTLGTIVGVTAFADDSDSGDTVSYSLDDNDGGRFAINSSSGVVTVAGPIDREIDGATRSITVRATSTDTSSITQLFVIAIADVDEFDVTAPIDSDATINAVDENAATNTVVGVTAFASDADASNSAITYALDDNAGGRFKIDSAQRGGHRRQRHAARPGSRCQPQHHRASHVE